MTRNANAPSQTGWKSMRGLSAMACIAAVATAVAACGDSTETISTDAPAASKPIATETTALAPADQPSSPTLSTSPAETTAPATTAAATPAPASTSAPSTTGPEAEPGWSGGLLDDLDTESLRPHDSLTEGDVIIPTGPSGWRVEDSRWTGVDPGFSDWSVDVIEARPNNGFGQHLYLTMSREPTCPTRLGCRPSGESVTIDGVVWESIVVERIPEDDPEFFDATTLRALVGDRWVSLAAGAPQLLTGLWVPEMVSWLFMRRFGTRG